MNPEDLESLSPEEREALQDDAADESALAAATDGEAPEADAAQAADAATDDKDASDSEDDTADADTAQAADTADDVEPDVVTPAKSPTLDPASITLTGHKGISDADEQLEALKAKFDEGEIELSDYLTARDEIQAAKIRAAMYEDLNAQFRRASWEQAQRNFYQQNKDIAGNPVMFSAFSGVLQSVLDSEEGKALGDYDVLDAAKTKLLESVKAMFGGTPAEPHAEKAKPADEKKELVKQLKQEEQKKKADVKTLAGVPAADAPDVGQDAFAHLDELSGEELEFNLAKLTSDQKQRYLALQ